MNKLRQDILDSFTHLNEKVLLHNVSLKPKQEQITSFGLTDEEIQKQVTQNGSSWEVDPISLKQLEELDGHWSTPATESCTNSTLFSCLPYLEYQYSLSFHSTSPVPCIPPLPELHRLSYRYTTERRKRKRQEKGKIQLHATSAAVSAVKTKEKLDRYELVTIEELEDYKTIDDTSITIDILDGEETKESVDVYDIKLTRDDTMNGNDKMIVCGDDLESMDMSSPYFRPERDVSNFESLQKVPNVVSPMHNDCDCELDNYRFQFV